MMEYHNSPNAMAKCLVQYIDCNERIRREVMATFDSAPCVETIRSYRATYQRPLVRSARDFDRTVVWMDERYTNDMNAANRRFVAAIERAKVTA